MVVGGAALKKRYFNTAVFFNLCGMTERNETRYDCADGEEVKRGYVYLYIKREVN